MSEIQIMQQEFRTAWVAYYLIGCPICRATYSKRLLRCPGCGTLNPLYTPYMNEADKVMGIYGKWRDRVRKRQKRLDSPL